MKSRLRNMWGKLANFIFGADEDDPTPFVKLVMCAIRCMRKVSLCGFIKRRFCGRWQNGFVDWYVVVVTGILFTLLFVKPFSPWSFGLASYFMAEMFVETLGVVLLDHNWDELFVRSPQRSVLLVGLGYMELIAGFAIVYLRCGVIAYGGCANTVVEKPFHALYFSAMTITTVGFGDISPCANLGRAVTMIETLAGITLIVLVLSIFISKGKVKSGNRV